MVSDSEPSKFQFQGWNGINGTTTFLENWMDSYSGPEESRTYTVWITSISGNQINYAWKCDAGTNGSGTATIDASEPTYIDGVNLGFKFRSMSQSEGGVPQTYNVKDYWEMTIQWIPGPTGVSTPTLQVRGNSGGVPAGMVLTSDDSGSGNAVWKAATCAVEYREDFVVEGDFNCDKIVPSSSQFIGHTSLKIFHNGLLLIGNGNQYNASDYTVKLTSSCNDGDRISMIWFK